MLLGDQGSAARTRAGERRFRLKAATDAAHVRVESIIRSADMLDSPEGWLRYLQATFEMRAAAELALDAADAQRVFPPWPTRRLAALVAADILDLDGSCESAGQIWPEFSEPAELLGVLYVLEGSALGARVITRLADRMGYTEGFGARHLHAQAEEKGAWRAYLAALEAARLDPVDEERLAEAANWTFDRFAACYARHARAA